MQELFIPYSENIIIPSIKWQQVFKLIDCGNKNFKGRYPKSCKQKKVVDEINNKFNWRV